MPGTKHILVIRLSAMGDVAMTVPLIRALVQQYPQVKITVVSRALFKPFFEDIPRVAFHAADTNGKHKGLLGIWRLYKELKVHHIFAVADLHNVLRSKLLTLLFKLRGKKTATTNKARGEKKALTRAENKVFKQLTPVIQRHANVFKQLGFPVNIDKATFPEKAPLTPDILEITGDKKQPWIGIAPFAQHASKAYPKDLMQEVINKLAFDGNYKLLLFGGGKEETVQLEGFAKGHTNVEVIAGRLKLRQELRLMKHLDVMLSMDSGNGHMAAMLGVKVVTLWGATHPYSGFAPYNQPPENSIMADREKYPLLPTSIYGNKKIEGYENAMRTITPDSIVAKIKEILHQ